MGKLLTLLILASLAIRAFSGQWPWELWARSERSQAEAQARALLQVGRAASRDEIEGAYRRLIVQVHPDRGGTAQQVHAANQARDLLLARLERGE